MRLELLQPEQGFKDSRPRVQYTCAPAKSAAHSLWIVEQQSRNDLAFVANSPVGCLLKLQGRKIYLTPQNKHKVVASSLIFLPLFGSMLPLDGQNGIIRTLYLSIKVLERFEDTLLGPPSQFSRDMAKLGMGNGSFGNHTILT